MADKKNDEVLEVPKADGALRSKMFGAPKNDESLRSPSFTNPLEVDVNDRNKLHSQLIEHLAKEGGGSDLSLMVDKDSSQKNLALSQAKGENIYSSAIPVNENVIEKINDSGFETAGLKKGDFIVQDKNGMTSIMGKEDLEKKYGGHFNPGGKELEEFKKKIEEESRLAQGATQGATLEEVVDGVFYGIGSVAGALIGGLAGGAVKGAKSIFNKVSSNNENVNNYSKEPLVNFADSVKASSLNLDKMGDRVSNSIHNHAASYDKLASSMSPLSGSKKDQDSKLKEIISDKGSIEDKDFMSKHGVSQEQKDALGDYFQDAEKMVKDSKEFRDASDILKDKINPKDDNSLLGEDEVKKTKDIIDENNEKISKSLKDNGTSEKLENDKETEKKMNEFIEKILEALMSLKRMLFNSSDENNNQTQTQGQTPGPKP